MSLPALISLARPPSCPNVGGVVPSAPVARESRDHRRRHPRPVDATPTRPRSDTAQPPPPSTRRLSRVDAPFDSLLSSHRGTKIQREICVTFAPNLERVRWYVPDDRRSRDPWFQPSHTATATTSPFLPSQREERTLASPRALADSDSDSYDSDDSDVFATVSVESDTNDGGRARTIFSLSRKQIIWCLWAMTGGRSIREFDLRGRTITDGRAVGNNECFVSGLESLLGAVWSTNTTTKTMRSATLRLLPRRRHVDESSWWFGGGGRLFAPDRGSSSRPTIALVANVFDRAVVPAAAPAALGRSKPPPFTSVAPFFRRETVLAAPSSARLPIAPPPTSSSGRGPCASPSVPPQHRATLLPTPPSSPVVAEKAVHTVAKDAVRTVSSPSSNPLHPPPRERIRERLLEQRRRNLLLSSRGVLDDPPTTPNNDDDDDDGGDAVFPFRSSVVAQRRLALRQRTPRPTTSTLTATATKDDARLGADDGRDAAEETRDDDAPRRAILDPDKRLRVTFSTTVRTLLYAPDDRVRAAADDDEEDDDAHDAPATRRRRRAPRYPTTTAASKTMLYDKRGYKASRTRKAYKYKHVST